MWKRLPIQIVQPAQALGPAQLRRFREKERYGLAHMHPLPLCVKITLQIFSSMLSRLYTTKAPTFIRLNSHHQLAYIVQHEHMHSSAILKLAHFVIHACACMHRHTQAHTHGACSGSPHDALRSSSKHITPSDGSMILRPVL